MILSPNRGITNIVRGEGSLAEQGLRAKTFVKRYSWDNITDDFEAILRHF